MSTAVLFSPVPRTLAHSSLGFHAACAGLQPCERAALPPSGPPRAIESGRPISDFDVILASVAWEPEVLALASSLRLAGVEPRRDRRPPTDPVLLGGGPVTLSNPDLLACVCDAVFVGEAEEAFGAIRAAIDSASDRDDLLCRLAALPGMHVPAVHGDAPPPPPARAGERCLPAHTVLADESNEFGDCFLVEVGRGCPRGCAFCVARAQGRARFVPAGRIVAAVPAATRRVGLLGAAVSDHPEIEDLVDTFARRGVGVTLGSVRADRLTPRLLRSLVAAGLRTLTVAADGPSEASRERLHKGIHAEDLERAAELARETGVSRLKVYVMVGLPGETGADIDEFAALVRRLSSRVRVAVSVSPFVPKRFTPMADAPFAGAPDLKRRLAELRRAIRGSAAMKATSPREAELEWRLSHARELPAITG